MRIEKPGRQIELGEEATFYGYEDLFIGNVLNINEFQFQLATADEFTLSYMEGNKHLVITQNYVNTVNYCVAYSNQKKIKLPG